jgi:hypothetical protein
MIAPINTTMPAFEGLFSSVLSGQTGLRRREKEAYTLMAFRVAQIRPWYGQPTLTAYEITVITLFNIIYIMRILEFGKTCISFCFLGTQHSEVIPGPFASIAPDYLTRSHVR